MTEPGPERRVERFVVLVAAAAALAYGIAIAIVAQVPLPQLLSSATLLGVALLAAAYVAFQFFGFEFQWRGHWLTANLDEAVIFLGLFYLPGPLIVLLAPLVELVVHGATGRPRVKGIFNVGQLVLATIAAWDAYFLATTAGMPALAAAALAVPVYVLTSNLLLSGVFATLESAPLLSVYLQRLAPTTLILSITGIAAGLTVHALWSVHPLAIVALAPFALAVRRNTTLASRADREARAHRALAGASARLVTTWDLDAIADSVLATLGETVPAGRAEIALARGRSWARDFEAGPGEGGAPLVVPIPARAGEPLGTLTVRPRPGQRGFDDVDRALVETIAAQTGSALLNADAVDALEHAHRRDVAQRDRLAKQEKLSSLGMLIANVSHEIGNPLSYMRLSLATTSAHVAKLAAHEDASVRAQAEKMQKSVDTVRKGMDHVVEIAGSLRNVARPGTGERRATDLNGIAKDVANVVRVGFAKQVALELELSPEPVMMHANGGELTQVVLNLAKNAAEAIGERGGRVVIFTRRDGDRRVIGVRDDGPGMPPEVAARLFQPFFTTKDTGTGVGLHVSRAIAKAHGGDLVCQTREGEGTTFTMTLPEAAPVPASGPDPRPAVAGA